MPVRLLAALSIAVGIYVALRIYPSDLPAPQPHPDFLATVFQSRALIFTGRATLLCIAAFVVLSIVARIWNREWLSKAGPFEVSTAAVASEKERDELSQQVTHAHAAVRDLDARFVQLTALSEFLVEVVARQQTGMGGGPDGTD